MPYRTITTALIDRRAPHALEAAIAHADRWRSHLEVCCFAEADVDPGFSAYSPAVLTKPHRPAEERCEQLAAEARRRLSQEDIAWSARSAIASPTGAAHDFALRARYADLAILPRPGAGVLDGAFFEAMLFDAGLPILVPRSDRVPDYATVLVAWDGSPVALAALRAAVPVLQAARDVRLAVAEPRDGAAEWLLPQAQDAATYLSRYGISAEVNLLPGPKPPVAEALVNFAGEIDADLMVMGAYGHTRLRERLLGGVTRAMLERAPVSLLIAH